MRRAIRIAFFFALIYCIIYAEINREQHGSVVNSRDVHASGAAESAGTG
jgi:hypothetical protein